jgi:glycosyltransferase involved in cell wall biosynthesis
MNKNQLVSVLMPNYNCEKYLSEAIESILNQTYKNFEFIIFDDCSTDKSWEIIQKYAKKSKKIKCFRNEKNLKITKTRNKLFEKISKKSKYFAIMDSDDISMPKRLEEQVNFLEKKENKNFVGCGSGLEYFWNDSKKTLKRFYEKDYEKLKKISLIKSPFPQATMLIETKILKTIGNYDEKYEVCEDWDFWIRILKKYEMTNLNKILYKYRQFETQSKSKKLKLTIFNGIKLKLKYMKFSDFFNFSIVFRIVLEIGLLILPTKLILWLFYKMEFKE